MCGLITFIAGVAAERPNIISRPNWGVEFVKIGRMLNGASYVRTTWMVPVPRLRLAKNLTRIPCENPTQQLANCRALNKAVDHANSLSERLLGAVRRDTKAVLGAFPSVESHDRRKKRDVRPGDVLFPGDTNRYEPDFCEKPFDKRDNFWTSLWSTVLHKPSYSDLALLYKQMCKAAKLIDQNKKGIFEFADELSALSLEINDRIELLDDTLDNLQTRVDESGNHLQSLVSNVRGIQYNLTVRLNFMQKAQHLHQSYIINLHHFLASVRSRARMGTEFNFAVHQMLAGKLSHALIPTDIVSSAMMNAVRKMRSTYGSTYSQVLRAPSEFYSYVTGPLLLFTRSDNYLFITAKIPFSSQIGVMDVYRIVQNPLRVSATKNIRSRVDDLPEIFAITTDSRYYTEMSAKRYLSCSSQDDSPIIRVCETETAVESTLDKDPRCSAAIFHDRATNACGLSMGRDDDEDRPVEVQSLSGGRYSINLNGKLLLAEDRWIMKCDNTTSLVPPCESCFVTVPCGCSLVASNLFMIPRRFDGECQRGRLTTTTTVYPVNLHILAQDPDFLPPSRLTNKPPVFPARWQRFIDSFEADLEKLWLTRNIISRSDIPYATNLSLLLDWIKNGEQEKIYATKAHNADRVISDEATRTSHELSALEKFILNPIVQALLNPEVTKTGFVLFTSVFVLVVAMNLVTFVA